MKTSEKIDQILPALFKVKAEVKSLSKDASNPYFSSKYVDLNTVLEGVEPLLANHNIIVLQPVNGSAVETLLIHSSGQFISSEMNMVLNKNDMQAVGSAVSYARRYTLMSLLSLKAVDDDGEASVGRTAPAKAPVKTEKPSTELTPTLSSTSTKQSSFKPKVPTAAATEAPKAQPNGKASTGGGWS